MTTGNASEMDYGALYSEMGINSNLRTQLMREIAKMCHVDENGNIRANEGVNYITNMRFIWNGRTYTLGARRCLYAIFRGDPNGKIVRPRKGSAHNTMNPSDLELYAAKTASTPVHDVEFAQIIYEMRTPKKPTLDDFLRKAAQEYYELYG